MRSSGESDFSVITPAFNAADTLPMCVASVADQSGVSVQHVVVDGGSGDGTIEWCAAQEGLEWTSEKDRGMYDALNKGLARSRGRFVAHLNADEQYLPGVLHQVLTLFEANPDCDLVFGDALVVDSSGRLVAARKSYPLRWPYVMASHLYIPTCCMVWRKTAIGRNGQYDTTKKTSSDAEFVVRALRGGIRTRRLRRYVAAFSLTGRNLGASPVARGEVYRARRSAPTWIQVLRPALNAIRHAEKALHGSYFQKFPLRYSLYTSENLHKRTEFASASASVFWPPDTMDTDAHPPST